MIGFHERGREWNDIENDERAHGWLYVNEDVPLDYYDDEEETFTSDDWDDKW